jgi:hypothetical protein
MTHIKVIPPSHLITVNDEVQSAERRGGERELHVANDEKCE